MRILKVLLCCIGLFVVSEVVGGEQGTVIIADVCDRGPTYELDGSSFDLDGLVTSLRVRAARTNVTPKEDTALVLASKELTIGQLQTLKSTLAAYGFLDIRLFVFGKSKERLSGLSFGDKAISFTTDRAELLHAFGNPK